MTNQGVDRLVRSLRLQFDGGDTFELRDHLDIPMLWQDLLLSMSGFCLCFQQRFTIMSSPSVLSELRVYVCAHELGHVLLHGRTSTVRLAEMTSLHMSRLGDQADYFAVCLLLQDRLPGWREWYGLLIIECVAQLPGLPARVASLCVSDGHVLVF